MNKCLYCGKDHNNAMYCSNSCRAKDRNRGRTPSEETRLKLSEAKLGDKNVNYKDGRRVYRYKAITHYGERCYCCGTTEGPFDVHHVTGDYRSHELWNLVVLCVLCHQTVAHIPRGIGKAPILNLEFRDKILKERGVTLEAVGY